MPARATAAGWRRCSARAPRCARWRRPPDGRGSWRARRHLVQRQRRGARARGRDPAIAVRRTARGSRADRHARGLRARGVRLLHRAARRAAGALVPRARGAGRGLRGAHGGGPRRAGRSAGPTPAGVQAGARAAVRLLHAGLFDDRVELLSRRRRDERRGDPRGARRAAVPLHGLRGDRPGRARGGRDGGRLVTTRLFGERVERREDDRLLVGRGRYTDDFESGAAHAAFVRSDYAHARIADIDVSGALDVDGVLAVYTYEDLEGRFAEPLPLIIPHEAITDGRTQYALARDEVRYVGETIAMVVARDRYIAEDAAGAIAVKYEPLAVVADLEQAAAGDVLVHGDRADNVVGRVAEEHGDVDAAFAEAAHVFEWRFEIERSAATPLEGRGVVARFDEDGGLLVYDSTQAPTGIRNGLSRLFDIPLERVHVVAPDVGGGFGVKVIQFYPEEVMVPLAARALGLPVKWTEDRREHFIGSTHERKQIHRVRVGASADGRILALETSFLHDSGAYCPYGLIIPVISAAQLPGPYRLDNYRYDFTALFTNRIATSPYRGAGRPHGAYVMERVMDRLAVELGLDRAEIRRRNFIRPDEFPYDVGVTFQDGGPTVYDSGDYPAGLDLLLEAVDYAGFGARREAARAQGRQIGIGIACYVEGTGIGPYEGAAVDVHADGTVTVATGLSSQGQGHQTMLAQIAGDELGVAIERIRVTTGDTRRIGWGVGTFASRTAVVSGNAVQKAAAEVRRQATELAARLLEADPQDIEFSDGRVDV